MVRITVMKVTDEFGWTLKIDSYKIGIVLDGCQFNDWFIKLFADANYVFVFI